MSAAEKPHPGPVIPDGIDPVEAERCWLFDGRVLRSLNGHAWQPCQPLVATCLSDTGAKWCWNIVRGGQTREEAARHANAQNKRLQFGLHGPVSMWVPQPPKTEPPRGHGFKLIRETHDAPDETCTCGIYAATNATQLPQFSPFNILPHQVSVIYGKVKLWGKVIPGEKGARAQFAYPSEFAVPPALANNPVLKSFGVPMTVAEPQQPQAQAFPGGLAQFIATNLAPPTIVPFVPPAKQKTSTRLRFAMAYCLIFGTLNLVLAALRFHL